MLFDKSTSKRVIPVILYISISLLLSLIVMFSLEAYADTNASIFEQRFFHRFNIKKLTMSDICIEIRLLASSGRLTNVYKTEEINVDALLFSDELNPSHYIYYGYLADDQMITNRISASFTNITLLNILTNLAAKAQHQTYLDDGYILIAPKLYTSNISNRMATLEEIKDLKLCKMACMDLFNCPLKHAAKHIDQCLAVNNFSTKLHVAESNNNAVSRMNLRSKDLSAYDSLKILALLANLKFSVSSNSISIYPECSN